LTARNAPQARGRGRGHVDRPEPRRRAQGTPERKETMITPRQEKFAREVATGKTQVDAYKDCYPRARTWRGETAVQAASRLASKVATRIAELRAASNASAIMDLRRARIILSAKVERLAEDEASSTADLCRAVDSLARISGWLSPAAIAVSVSPADTPTPEERARRIREALGVPDGEEGGGHD